MSRTIVVTGANRGIGYAVVRALAEHPDTNIVMLCRDKQAGARARDELAPNTRAELTVVQGALDNVRGIHEAADRLAQACPQIDVLIHNAGIWPAHLVKTADGLEQAFVVNHLAPFVLNRRLEAKLTQGTGRVVQVSAGLYVKGKLDLTRTPTGADFSALTTYATTKLCNLLLLPKYAERFRALGVTINAVHPGVIRTGLGDRDDLLGIALKLVKRLWKDSAEAAPPIVRLALEPALTGVSGCYFDCDKPQALMPNALNVQQAEALWHQAEQLTGLTTLPDAKSTAR
jgi:NAD(P)-dependent dehydrogenase (short-subunit alcohol dehydrogenase family)